MIFILPRAEKLHSYIHSIFWIVCAQYLQSFVDEERLSKFIINICWLKIFDDMAIIGLHINVFYSLYVYCSIYIFLYKKRNKQQTFSC